MYQNATKSDKFSALNGIAETNKKGNGVGGLFVFDAYPVCFPPKGAC